MMSTCIKTMAVGMRRQMQEILKRRKDRALGEGLTKKGSPGFLV